MTFRIVTREGTDTIHGPHPTERCNLDDTERDDPIGQDDAWLVIKSGSAEACRYCFPLPSELVP
jgi:hypothetical protein